MEEVIRIITALVLVVSAVYVLLKRPKANLKQESWEKILATLLLIFGATNLFNLLVSNSVIPSQEHIKTATFILLAIFSIAQSFKVYKFNKNSKNELSN